MPTDDDNFPFGRLAAPHDTARLIGECWPAYSADRHVPGAIEWVRRWGPRAGGVALRPCTCDVGRCASCG